MKKSKIRYTFIIGISAILSSCLFGCDVSSSGGSCVPTPTPTSVESKHYFSTNEFVNENLNEIAQYIKKSTDVPEEYLREPTEENKGTIETVTYNTRAYAYEEYFKDELNGKTLPVEKKMYVYLPCGYDAEKKYSTLYLIHGGHEIVDYWFSMNTEKDDDGKVGEGAVVRMLDNMIALGVIDPLIVVTPAIYVETNGYHAYPDGDLDQRHPKPDKTANDPDTVCSNKLTVWTDNFATELRNDIIPIIDSKYSTYADRLHRGIGGTSMGSMTTIRAGLWRCNDLFSWYAPMSSGVTAEEDQDVIEEQTRELLDAICKDGKIEYDISMLLNFNGLKDMSKKPHQPCMEYLLQNSNGGLRNGDNYALFMIDKFEHNFNAWRYDLCLILQVFFKT